MTTPTPEPEDAPVDPDLTPAPSPVDEGPQDDFEEDEHDGVPV